MAVCRCGAAYDLGMPNQPVRNPRASRAKTRQVAATRVLRQFRQVFNAIKTHFQQVEKRAGMGGAQLWALSIIGTQPGIGVGELAKAMDVHQSTASNLIKGLVERRMLRVERSSADRRAVHLHLAAAGAAALRKAPAPFAGVLPDALAALDEKTLQRLYKDLNVLLAVLHADKRAARTPLAEL